MKKILFLAVFMVFSTFAFNAMAGAPPPACDNSTSCATCAGGSQQTTCCTTINVSLYNNATQWNQSGCNSANAPINKGLILLVIAGMGLGAYVVYKNRSSKLV